MASYVVPIEGIPATYDSLPKDGQKVGWLLMSMQPTMYPYFVYHDTKIQQKYIHENHVTKLN